MQINNGTFTIHRGAMYRMVKAREDAPISDYEKQVMLYLMETDIRRPGHASYETKYLLDITNAFTIRSYGLYRNEEVQVFSRGHNIHKPLAINTRDQKIAASLEFFKILDNWYGIDVGYEDLTMIWEKREPTWNLPMLPEVQTTKFVYFKNNPITPPPSSRSQSH